MRIDKLRNLIIDKFKSADIPWQECEPQTVLLELGLPADWVNIDKVGLLRVLEIREGYHLEDPIFFLHAVEVINNNPVDFHHIPTPTSLEIAFAIVMLSTMYPNHLVYSEGVKAAVKWILIEEGYSVPLAPFNAMVGSEELMPGQTGEDTENKRKAIVEYVKGMLNDSTD